MNKLYEYKTKNILIQWFEPKDLGLHEYLHKLVRDYE